MQILVLGKLSRSDSANLVLHKHARHILAESGATETFQDHAPNGSGIFLLRLSKMVDTITIDFIRALGVHSGVE